MDNLKKLCWADSSEDSSSDTEEGTPLPDPNTQELLDSILSSSSRTFYFKLENLPYTLSSPADLSKFLDLKENEAEVRLQYKGQKFSGSATVLIDNKNTALRLVNKNNAVFRGRPVLMLCKLEESEQWIPHRIRKSRTSVLSQTCVSKMNVGVNPKNMKSKSFSTVSAFTPKQIRQNDPAIVGMVVGQKHSAFRRIWFE